MKMLLAYIRKIKLLKGNNFSIAKGKGMNIDQFSFAPSKLSYVISKPCVMSSSVDPFKTEFYTTDHPVHMPLPQYLL